MHEFSINKGKLLKTGAYIEGDSAGIHLCSRKRGMNAALFYLINQEIPPVWIDIPAEYSTGSLYSVRLHGFAGMSMHIILELMEKGA